MKKIILWTGLASLVLPLWSSTAGAVACSNSAIQAAINSAKDGDTIAVDAGSCTWTGNVTMPSTKGLKLIGAGSSGTIITMNGYTLNLETSKARKMIRIAGFTFKKSNIEKAIIINGDATNWRIDDNVFDDDGIYGSYTIYLDSKNGNTTSLTYGVIDSNRFINRNYATSIFIEWPVSTDQVNGDWIWSQPAQRGTAQAVYIESNVFSGIGAASQVVDGRWGMKYVLRYNTIHNPWISTHSACTNRGREPIWVEIYKNTFTDDGNNYGGSQVEMRSVSGIAWGNTAANKLNKYAISVDHERSSKDCAASTGNINYGGWCNGTQSIDGNTVSLHGYVCLGQPGWGQPQATDMRAYTFQGVFAWGNTDGGSPLDLDIANNSTYSAEHLVAGREYFNASNMTIGPIGNRPATCSPGPSNRSVYASTDENPQGATVYACTAPDVWTKHWEPYEYPHPLRLSGKTPGYPPNVRVSTD
jgi:hypothetical protein